MDYMTKMAGDEDYKSFYFTSLLHLLSDNKHATSHNSQARSKGAAIPHSKPPVSKKPGSLGLQSDSEQFQCRPLPVDPIFLTRKNEWGRKSLTHNSRSQQSYERDVEAYSRQTEKAIRELRSSKAYHTNMLRHMQDRQMEICRNRVREQILIQAQSRYDRVPVLETKRLCGACARRPKSAKANVQVTVDGLLRSSAKGRSSCHRMTFSMYEQMSQPPRPYIRQRKAPSAGGGFTLATSNEAESDEAESDETDCRSEPSPANYRKPVRSLSAAPRCASPEEKCRPGPSPVNTGKLVRGLSAAPRCVSPEEKRHPGLRPANTGKLVRGLSAAPRCVSPEEKRPAGPSPVNTGKLVRGLSAAPRCVSPIRTFDSSLIPDSTKSKPTLRLTPRQPLSKR